VAVGVGDQGDGQGIDAGQPGPRADGDDRQLGVVPAGQVLADLPEDVLDDEEVVQEPLGVRGERLLGVGGPGGLGPGGVQDPLVVAQAA
jgi:hypothetical protein